MTLTYVETSSKYVKKLNLLCESLSYFDRHGKYLTHFQNWLDLLTELTFFISRVFFAMRGQQRQERDEARARNAERQLRRLKTQAGDQEVTEDEYQDDH